MAEEFDESNVVFSGHDRRRFSYLGDASTFNFRDFIWSPESKNDGKKTTAISVPVHIPHRVFQFWEEYGDGAMEPPHLIVERRRAGKMTYSVCSGTGRTLKGRDQSEVRNSILRLTGFLET